MISTTTQRKAPRTASEKKRLLELLTYEMHEGKPIYYRGWQEVVSGKKQLEQIMASSILQAWLSMRLAFMLILKLEKDYEVLGNEVGLLFEKGSWRAADLALFKKGSILELHNRYSDVMPEIVIEIDTKADNTTVGDYFHKKTQQLLDNGIQKVIWIFTASQKVMIAEIGKNWVTMDWDNDIVVTPNCMLNIQEIINKY